MRHSSAVILMALMVLFSAITASAQRLSVSGRVVDSEAQPITYASVALTQNDKLITGCTSDIEGKFSIGVNAGNYELVISFIGYEYYKQTLALTESVDLGDITLTESSEQIEEVVVTSQLIRREADRFVVDVANSPLAMGKDGEELLKSSPGVWIQDDKISINGASGSKVYLNDREVKMEDAQLIAYLRSLRANDIQRIEVIPQSGADYDAASAGGIIKITTKKRLDSGLMGSASLVANGTKGLYNVMPSVSLNYNSGNLNLYGRTWAGVSGQQYTTKEHTDYTSGTLIDAATKMDENSNWAGLNLGFVYDITPKHSVGAEVQHNYYGHGDITDTWTEHTALGTTIRSDGDYTSAMTSNMTTATLNYIYKLDDMGSTLKFIGDYTRQSTPQHNDFFDINYNILTPSVVRDSTYRYDANSRYHLATATVALEKVLSPKVTLKAGAKYTYNKNANYADYEYLDNEAWMPNLTQSYDIGYTENIGAAYAIATARLGRVSLVGGLRGEQTWFESQDGSVKQRYFDLFPNANVSYALTADGAYSLIAQYSRTISRPSFWALSPNETKISEYMIQRGNPNLKPSYNNSVSVTAVLKYKYTVTMGIQIMENAIQQATIADEHNPELLILQTINYPTMNNLFASINLPFQITKWWSTNVNSTAMYMGQRIYPDEPVRRVFMFQANAQMSFTLPKEFFIELDGHFVHGAQAGNTRIKDFGNMNVMLKKRLLDNKLTLSLGATNILNLPQTITIEEEGFKRVMTAKQPWSTAAVKFSVSYNFNSGKQFRAKSVESGSAEDRGRLGNTGN